MSTDGDVYSYGILILEIFTGERPTDDLFSDGFSLHYFAKAAFSEEVVQIIDPNLLAESQGEDSEGNWSSDRLLKIQECLVSIVEIGAIHSSKAPRNRMSMSDVVADLQAARMNLLESWMGRRRLATRKRRGN